MDKKDIIEPLLLAENQGSQFKASMYRWVILAGCMLSTFNAAFSASTIVAVAVPIKEAYEVSSVTVVNLHTISFEICAIPFGFFCIIALAKYQLSTVMRWASLAQFVGMLIRDISILNGEFWPMLVGVFIQSATIPFFLNTQAQISNRWFPDSQRALAMSLLTGSTAIGNGSSVLLTGYFFKGVEEPAEVRSALNGVLIVHTFLITCSFLFFQATFQDWPKQPPSAAALAKEENQGLIVGLKEIYRNKSVLLLTISFTAFSGLYFAVCNLQSSMFYPLGFTPMQITTIAIATLSSGVVGATLTGCFLDRTSLYKRTIIVLMVAATIISGLLAQQVITGKTFALMLVQMMLLGMTMFSVLPASLGLAIELTFPMQPSLVNGIMLLFGQISAVLQSVAYSAFLEANPEDFPSEELLAQDEQKRVVQMLGIWLLVILASLACLCCVKEDLKRLNYSQKEESPYKIHGAAIQNKDSPDQSEVLKDDTEEQESNKNRKNVM